MPRDVTLDTILASGQMATAWRVLTSALDWPAGDPPWANGDHLSVPTLPTTTAPTYDADDFDPAIWTDATGLVQSYRYSESMDKNLGQLSLVCPARWGAGDINHCFGSMRAIVVQERFAGADDDTGWLNRCFCLSTGYQIRLEAKDGNQQWTVGGLDVLMLANLDPLGTDSGSAVREIGRAHV